MYIYMIFHISMEFPNYFNGMSMDFSIIFKPMWKNTGKKRCVKNGVRSVASSVRDLSVWQGGTSTRDNAFINCSLSGPPKEFHGNFEIICSGRLPLGTHISHQTGKGKSSSNTHYQGDMLISVRLTVIVRVILTIGIPNGNGIQIVWDFVINGSWELMGIDEQLLFTVNDGIFQKITKWATEKKLGYFPLHWFTVY